MGFWSKVKSFVSISRKTTTPTTTSTISKAVSKKSSGGRTVTTRDVPAEKSVTTYSDAEGNVKNQVYSGGGGSRKIGEQEAKSLALREGGTVDRINNPEKQTQTQEAKKLEPTKTESQDVEPQQLSISDDSERRIAYKPYDERTEQGFGEKVKLTAMDYTLGLPSLIKTSLQKGLGTGGQGLDPFGAVTNLFSPFDRFKGERRIGTEEYGVDQGTGTYNIETGQYEQNLKTGYEKIDEQTIANPELLLPAEEAYRKDYQELVDQKAEELRPKYESEAESIRGAYQTKIKSGELTTTQAEKGYSADIENLNERYKAEVISESQLDPADSENFQKNIKFKKMYGDYTRDISVKPSTAIAGGLVIAGGSVGGATGVAVNTLIGVGGASQAIDPSSTKLERTLGATMFVAGTYGALKLSANMVTQQQIVDVSKAKGTTTFTRTSFNKYNFQDDFSSSAKTSNAKITRYGSARYTYDKFTKTYKVTGGQTNQIVTTDYWTGKTLEVTNYQTFSGVGEQVSTGTLKTNWYGGTFSNPQKTSKIKEVLNKVEFDTEYTYTKLGNTETIRYGGKSGTRIYQSFVLSDKNRIFSVTAKTDDLYLGTKSTSQVQKFTTSGGSKITIRSSAVSNYPESAVGNVNSLTTGFIDKSDDLLAYREANPAPTGRGRGEIIYFKADPTFSTKKMIHYRELEMQYATPSVFDKVQVSQGLAGQPASTSNVIMQKTPLTIIQTTPSASLSNAFGILAPSAMLVNSLSSSQIKDRELVKTSVLPSLSQKISTVPFTETTPTTRVSSRIGTASIQETGLSSQGVGSGVFTSVVATGLGAAGIGFGFPSLSLGAFSMGSGSKNVPTKQRFKYTPDYTSLITGRRGKKGESIFGTEKYAGFETRPITKEWSKMLVSGFGIKRKKKRRIK